MFPTPRRALFTTSTLMDSGDARGKHEDRVLLSSWRRAHTDPAAEYATTPPLAPSSSPAHVDMMDMSPLPLKVSYVSQAQALSPSPLDSASDDMDLASPAARHSSQEPAKGAVAE